MSNRTLEERIEELTTRLNRLTLQQDNINIRVIYTRRELATLRDAVQANKTTTTRTRTRTPELGAGYHVSEHGFQASTTANPTTDRDDSRKITVVTGSGYCIGDQVQIINPSPGQEDQGVVIGETRDKLLKIKPILGRYIKRLPKNVRKS